MAMIRKKIRWATKRRKCGARVWKTKWMTIYTKEAETKDAKPKSGGPSAPAATAAKTAKA